MYLALLIYWLLIITEKFETKTYDNNLICMLSLTNFHPHFEELIAGKSKAVQRVASQSLPCWSENLLKRILRDI